MQNIAQDIASNDKNDRKRHINDQIIELYTKKLKKNNDWYVGKI